MQNDNTVKAKSHSFILLGDWFGPSLAIAWTRSGRARQWCKRQELNLIFVVVILSLKVF